MTMGRGKNDFLETTKKELAKRAGYVCSFPGCKVSTSGPDTSNRSKAIGTGQASHIYPAAPTGARGKLHDGGILRSDISNGIWMCNLHGGMIDANGGGSFPPETLKKWRDNAEAAARLRQQGLPPEPAVDYIEVPRQTVGNGWIDIAGLRLELFPLTLVRANDALPLTLLSQALGFAVNSPTAAIEGIRGGPLEFTVGFRPGYRDPVRIHLESGHLNYWTGVRPTSTAFGAYRSILLDYETLKASLNVDGETSDPVAFSNGLDLDPLIIERLGAEVRNETNIQIKEIRPSGGRWEVHCESHSAGAFHPVAALSGSEQLSVHLALALAYVRLLGDGPNILIIDNLLHRYDESNLKRFGEVCSRLPNDVQVVAMDSSGRVGKVLDWPSVELTLSEPSDDASSTNYVLTQLS